MAKKSSKKKLKTSAPTPSKEAMRLLGEIFQAEMSGIVRYMHYSFMIMGPNRIPIQKWFRDRASEGMAHSTIIGEKITSLGGHPAVSAMTVEETGKHNVMELLEETLTFELEALNLYKELLQHVGEDIALEEMTRDFIRQETEHTDEVIKMLNRDR